VLTIVLALAVASGCEKTNDLPRLQEEALATAKRYQERFDELAHRAEAIGKRARTLPPSSQNSSDAQRVYGLAIRAISQARASLTQVPRQVEDEVSERAPGAPGKPPEALAKRRETLVKRIDNLREDSDQAMLEATADLSAVESWVTFAEQRPDAPPPAPGSDAAHDPGAGEPPVR